MNAIPVALPETILDIPDAETVRALYAALYRVTDAFWGVNDNHAGDTEEPAPSFVREARTALAKAVGL